MGGESFGVVTDMLDCNIIVSTNFSYFIAFTFGLMHLGKV